MSIYNIGSYISMVLRIVFQQCNVQRGKSRQEEIQSVYEKMMLNNGIRRRGKYPEIVENNKNVRFVFTYCFCCLL